jgi:glutamate racemase
MAAQDCDQLATQIEKAPRGDIVRNMIDGFLDQAVAGLPDRKAPTAAALCCTHYGYIADLIAKSLATRIDAETTILNPNTAMAGRILTDFGSNRSTRPNLEIDIVSRIKWNDGKLQAMAGILAEVSFPVARALLNYRLDPELFHTLP